AGDDADAGDGDFGPLGHATPRRNSSVTFWPPKPKELETAHVSCAERDACATQSNGTSGSGVTRFAVGGTTPCSSASTVAMASRVPAAAIVWPIMDLLDDTSRPPSPKTRASARASMRSFCGVPVP